jgi:hypothetical protein
MDFNATIDLIIKDLDDASDIIDDLKKYPGVPVLQVELAKSKCKSAGEVIALLKNLKESVPVMSGKVPESQITEQPKIPEEEKKAVTFKPVRPPVEKKEEPQIIKIVPPPAERNEVPKKAAEIVSGAAIVADSFSHLPGSYNEQIGSMKSDDDLLNILKTKPLTNLSDAIGVNDRFMFIREIFNNNNEAYSQAISRLDKTESMKDAMAVIMSYTGDDNENEAVKQLLELVKRKLPSDG